MRCRYVQRRAREGFVDARSVTDTAALEQLWQRARQELEVVRRQSVVYSLYARKHKSVMVRRARCGWLDSLVRHSVVGGVAGSAVLY